MKLFLIIFSLILSSSALADKITILHINDHHSHLEPNKRLDLNLDGEKTRVVSGGFPSVVAKFKELKLKNENVIKLHAGDAITGTLYYTLFKGKADAEMMNQICFDAFAIGNHEFDDGDKSLVEFLDYLHTDKCKTPVLSANIKAKINSPLSKKIKPYTIINKGNQKIGVIGILISKKTRESSNPDDTTLFLDEINSAQENINKLKQQGINKIILLTHYGYKNEINMAKLLTDVDVIVGGDSHSLTGDFDNVGLNSNGAYPTVVKNKNEEDVCIVTAWEYSQIVGELNIEFNNDGTIKSCDGIPHIMLDDSFKRKDSNGKRVEIDGNYREAVYKAIEVNPNISIVEADAQASKILEKYKNEVKEKSSEVIGRVTDDLCLERIPGQGKSKLCDVSKTEKNGSDISNIVAHAFREMSKLSDIAIQNGGGTRIDIKEGNITIGDAYTLLPFSNTIVELKMSGEEIKNVLEDSIDYALTPDGSTGAYPYAAGLRWDVQASNSKGNRVINLEFKGRTDKSWVKINPSKTYTVATNNYIAAGKDGYKTFGIISKQGRVVNTYLGYAQSFVDYVKKIKTLSKLPLSEYSTQSFTK